MTWYTREALLKGGPMDANKLSDIGGMEGMERVVCVGVVGEGMSG